MMLSDVAKWVVVQLAFMLGIASALYALLASPVDTTTAIFADGCEITTLGDLQVRGREGGRGCARFGLGPGQGRGEERGERRGRRRNPSSLTRSAVGRCGGGRSSRGSRRCGS